MTRVGLLVTREHVAVAVTRARRVVWECVTRRGPDVAADITAALAQLPGRVRWRRQARVAIDEPRSAVKTIRGLPPVRHGRTLARIVATAPERFFVLPGRSAVVTGVRVTEPGVVRAAVFDRELVDAVRDGLESAGFDLACVVPAEVAIAALSPEESRRPCAGALGAARLSRRESLVARPVACDDRPVRSGVAARFVAAAALATACAAGGALLLPPYLDGRAAAAARHQLASMPNRFATSEAGRRAVRTEHAFARVRAFERERVSMTLLLEAIARGLPAETRITEFRSDSGGTTLSVSTPRAADVVRAVSKIPHVSDAEITGPVTHTTTAGGLPQEQLTLHFRTAPDPPDTRTAFATPETIAVQ